MGVTFGTSHPVPVLLLLLVAVNVAGAAVPPIVPAQQLGPVRLGMSESTVVQTLGNPTEALDQRQVVWNLTFSRHEIYALFYDVRGRNPRGELISVTTRRATYRTSAGVTVGMARSDIERILGQPVERNVQGNEAMYYYRGLWVGFERNRAISITVVPREVGTALLPYVLDRAAKDKGRPSFRTVTDAEARLAYIAELLRAER